MRFFLLASLGLLLGFGLAPELSLAAPADTPADHVDHVEDYDKPRVRVGADFGGGFFTLPGTGNSGYLFAGQARVGTQFTSLLSVVFQAGIGYVGVVYDGEESDSWGGAVLQSSALAMLTLAGTFEIGLGPAVDLYVWGGPYASGPFGEPSFVPGGNARMALHVPGWTQRRPNFVLGADGRAGAYPTHYDGDFRPVVTGEVTAGVEWH